MAVEPGGSAGAVRRAVEVLELLSERSELTSIRAIAGATGLPKSSVARIVDTLVDTGMIEKDRHTFTLGPRLRRLGIRALDGMDVRAAARSSMAELSRVTGETVSLNVRFGEIRMYVEQVESSHMLRAKGEIGRPYPLLVGAPGRALIYPLGDNEIEGLLDRAELHQYTANTPVARETVWAAIRDARDLDAAIARDEVISGLATIAVPVTDRSGAVVAALGVTGPSSRVDAAQLLKLRPLVRQAADELSAVLGSQASTLRPAHLSHGNSRQVAS